MTSIRGFNLIATKCCGAVYSTARYASVNFSAMEHWTDGERVHSLMPTDGGLRRCSCGAYFLLKNTFSVGVEQERKTPISESVKDEELARVLLEQLAPDVESVVRRRYWRLLNDPYRELYRVHRERENLKFKKKNSFFSRLQMIFARVEVVTAETNFSVPEFTPSDVLMRNLQCLLRLNESESDKDYLEIAEINRELSEFEKAREALAMKQDVEDSLSRTLMGLIDAQINAPCRYRN